ncbi:MAG: sulfatase [Myxococcota bacterium]|jgi:arylsulfatase A-like enzyme|nr:sulfatase [Myxococcota bacterium]
MVALLVALFGCSPSLPAGDEGRPDIIFVSIDTLRADHLSTYGYERPTSPFFDQLAHDGTRFEQARSSSPWTLPAHTTMFTGLLPSSHQVVDDNLRLDESIPVLAETMSEAGYRTGGFVSTLYVSTLFGFERGFENFEDFGIHTEKKNLRGEVVAEDVVDSALSWWQKQPAGEPVFLFLHLYDVHYTYDPPAPFETLFDRAPDDDDRRYKNYFHFLKKPLDSEEFEHQIAQYDEAIRYVDTQLQRLDAAARTAERGVRWVITSDHGEEFGERGSWGHAHTLYAEQLHIPLIVSGPGLPEARVVEGSVGSHDLAPTIASWADSEMTGDGMDLGGPLDGNPIADRPLVAETTRFSTNRLSILEDGLRLEWDLKHRKRQLYDVREDPGESNDIARSRPEDVTRLARRIETLLGQPWQAGTAGTVTTDGIILRQGRQKKLTVEDGDRFQVLPYDAQVWFSPRGETPAPTATSEKSPSDARLGPWQANGGDRPGADAPLQVDASGTAQIEMDEATRAQLEALGYLQEAEPDETIDATEGQQGPAQTDPDPGP